MRGRFIFVLIIVIDLFAVLGRSEADGLFLSEFGTEDRALAGASFAAPAADLCVLPPVTGLPAGSYGCPGC